MSKKQPWLSFPPTLLDILNVSTNGKFSFWAAECQPDNLTVPNLPVTWRAAFTFTTTVIELQPVTVPPALFLLGSTIKHRYSALLMPQYVSATWWKYIWFSEIPGYSKRCFAYLNFHFNIVSHHMKHSVIRSHLTHKQSPPFPKTHHFRNSHH